MKTSRIIVVLSLLLSAYPCFASLVIDIVSKERAEKELGVRVRTEMVATNQIRVWFEFPPKGKLRDFGSVQLEITAAEGTLVSATLSPLTQNAESVVVRFFTAPAYLPSSKLTVFVKSGGWPEYGHGFQFNLDKFIKHEPAH